MIITIDGPSGTGKTTVARRVAEKMGFVYFDTGAMYRALTWVILQNNINLASSLEMESLISRFEFKIEEREGIKRYFVGEIDVTEAIRSRPVTAKVSEVAAQKEVRASLLPIQHQFAQHRNVVFEGRDLGTVVFPEAEIKIYLDADPEVRAERRLEEILRSNPQEKHHLNKDQMRQDLLRRDEYDSTREIAPLRCPEGAYRIDTSQLTIDQVVDMIVLYAKKKCRELMP
jgi:cytidylate kinase